MTSRRFAAAAVGAPLLAGILCTSCNLNPIPEDPGFSEESNSTAGGGNVFSPGGMGAGTTSPSGGELIGSEGSPNAPGPGQAPAPGVALPEPAGQPAQPGNPAAQPSATTGPVDTPPQGMPQPESEPDGSMGQGAGGAGSVGLPGVDAGPGDAGLILGIGDAGDGGVL